MTQTATLHPALYPARSAWWRDDLTRDPTWIYDLPPEALQEMAQAARRLSDDPQGWLDLNPEQIEAPRLKAALAAVAAELENGRGVALVRNIPVHLPLAEVYRQYWILAALMGRPVPHNGKGDVFGQVTDLGSRYGTDPFARGYTSTDEMVFHNDAGDVAGLLCIRSAKDGGVSSVVSTMAMYREAEAVGDPDLMAALRRGFRMVIRDDAGSNAKMGNTASRSVTHRRSPVYREWAGRLSGAVNLKSVGVVPQVTGEPFDEGEAKAFEFLSRTSEREDLKYSFMLAPGELLFMHNLVVLHKRSAFVDHPEPNRKRLLLRFWLALHNGRALPPDMAGLRRGFAANKVVNAVTERTPEPQGGEP